MVTRCYLLSVVVTLCHSLPLVVAGCTTRLSFYERSVTTVIGTEFTTLFFLHNKDENIFHENFQLDFAKICSSLQYLIFVIATWKNTSHNVDHVYVIKITHFELIFTGLNTFSVTPAHISNYERK